MCRRGGLFEGKKKWPHYSAAPPVHTLFSSLASFSLGVWGVCAGSGRQTTTLDFFRSPWVIHNPPFVWNFTLSQIWQQLSLFTCNYNELDQTTGFWFWCSHHEPAPLSPMLWSCLKEACLLVYFIGSNAARQEKEVFLGVPALIPSQSVRSCFICGTHTCAEQWRALARRYSEGFRMDGWHLHALIERVFVQYFSKADDFIRHIDLAGRWMVEKDWGNEQGNKGGKEEETERKSSLSELCRRPVCTLELSIGRWLELLRATCVLKKEGRIARVCVYMFVWGCMCVCCPIWSVLNMRFMHRKPYFLSIFTQFEHSSLPLYHGKVLWWTNQQNNDKMTGKNVNLQFENTIYPSAFYNVWRFHD